MVEKNHRSGVEIKADVKAIRSDTWAVIACDYLYLLFENSQGFKYYLSLSHI